MTRAAALALLLLANACDSGNGPMMDPFQDCLTCHSGGGGARTWTAAGTWSRGAHVTLVDANGKTVSLRGNEAGNFYTAEPLAFPLTVYVDGRVMTKMSDHVTPASLTYGGCNVCHHAETTTVGPLMAPGSDCLACHGPAGMAEAKFSAAGTWASVATSTDVSVGGASTTTNAAGNFIFCETGNPCVWKGASYGPVAPITSWPQPASVGGQSMPGGAPDGGCNRCHGRGGAD